MNVNDDKFATAKQKDTFAVYETDVVRQYQDLTDRMQGLMRSWKERVFSGYTMHHPNGPALSINCDFDSASKSGLSGEEKGHLRHERKVGILRFVPRELLL